MIERVIYCAVSSLAMLNPLPHEILLKREAGVVAAARDQTVLKMFSQRAEVSLLYFSRAAYDEAVRGLSSSEVDAVLRKRLQDWSPNAAGHGVNWTYQTAQRSLALTALAQTSRSRIAGTSLEDYFEQILKLLVTISGESRYQDMSMASLLVLVVEGDANLRAEYLDAQKAKANDSAAERFAIAAKRREDYCRELGAALQRLGRPEFAQALPYVGLSRGTFVRPRDQELVNQLRAHQVVYVIWKDGLVAGWSLANFVELEKHGKSARVLYFNPGQFLMDLQDFSSAQLVRELASRFEGGRGASMDARREHLCSLWLTQHLLRRKALAHSRENHREVAEILDREVAEETRALQQELAARPVWLEESEKASPLDALRKNETQLLQDATFLASLCRLEGDTHGEALFQRVSAFKPAQP